jgi:uncharacterized protein (TIGR02246 family)
MKRAAIALSLALCLGAISSSRGDQAADEAAIRKMAADYCEAFNRQDAKAVAAFWSPDAVYQNPVTGDEVTGREAIEQEMAAVFSETKDAKLEVSVESVEFVSPNVAVERGTARVLRPDAEPDETVYSAVHVKRDGTWLLDRMTEQPNVMVPSSYPQLKQLEWMIGTWVDEDENARIETTCSWTKNHNFINRTFTVSIGGQIEMSGMQLIGWDEAAGRIRSWVFDSDGGFGEATWTKKDNSWVVNSSATLPDGRKSSAVNVMTIVDDNTITWESTGRAVDGEILPNIEPIKITRNKSTEQ